MDAETLQLYEKLGGRLALAQEEVSKLRSEKLDEEQKWKVRKDAERNEWKRKAETDAKTIKKLRRQCQALQRQLKSYKQFDVVLRRALPVLKSVLKGQTQNGVDSEVRARLVDSVDEVLREVKRCESGREPKQDSEVSALAAQEKSGNKAVPAVRDVTSTQNSRGTGAETASSGKRKSKTTPSRGSTLNTVETKTGTAAVQSNGEKSPSTGKKRARADIEMQQGRSLSRRNSHDVQRARTPATQKLAASVVEKRDRSSSKRPSSNATASSKIAECHTPYRFHEVVRNKEQRRKMNGCTCEECEKFIDELYRAGAIPSKEEFVQVNSRHRHLHTPPSGTPDDFWRLSIMTDDN